MYPLLVKVSQLCWVRADLFWCAVSKLLQTPTTATTSLPSSIHNALIQRHLRAFPSKMSSPFDAEHWERVMGIVDEAWRSILETINPHIISEWQRVDVPPLRVLIAYGETRWPASSGPGTGPWGEGSLPYLPPLVSAAHAQDREACLAILNRDLCDDAPQVMGEILMDIVERTSSYSCVYLTICPIILINVRRRPKQRASRTPFNERPSRTSWYRLGRRRARGPDTLFTHRRKSHDTWSRFVDSGLDQKPTRL